MHEDPKSGENAPAFMTPRRNEKLHKTLYTIEGAVLCLRTSAWVGPGPWGLVTCEALDEYTFLYAKYTYKRINKYKYVFIFHQIYVHAHP